MKDKIEKEAVENLKSLIKNVKLEHFTTSDIIKFFRKGIRTGIKAAKKQYLNENIKSS